MLNELPVNYDIYFRYQVEAHVLGTIMNKAELDGIKDIIDEHQLSPKYFKKELYKDIMIAILKCYEEIVYPTLVHVGKFRPEKYLYNNSKEFTQELIYLSQKAYSNPRSLYDSIFLLKQYVIMDFWNEKSIDVLYGNWNGRDVIQVSDNIIKTWEKLWSELTDKLVSKDSTDYEQELIKKVSLQQQGLSVNVSTTVDTVDDFTAGYCPGELYIVGARPGMGKTTFALISAWETSKLGNPVLFFSLEMPENQLRNKIISLETGIDYKKIKAGNITAEQLREILRVNKYIDESPFHILAKVKTIDDISSKTKEYVEKYGIKLVVLDYIQRTKTSSKTTIREDITEITRELKSIAKDNYVAVLALSQLSRALEQRGNKRPMLSDLKESGSIEEDADLVAFLYRQAYYDERNGVPIPYSELFRTEFIVAKGRDLGTTTIELFVDAIKMKIYNYRLDGEYD